ncbi:HIR complex subunit [Coemansia sp. Benny D115]|nr:HIR complex subunit [Coemansia sp. Benny D115]
MRIIKPEWLRHDADKKKLTAIFSLDFHPDGTRLATAGMDNKIRLWSTQAIKDAAGSGDAADGSATPRLLSTLTAHSGAVMCARFSNGAGKYLASGADDMVVLIWERDESEAGGGHESGNILGHAAGGSEVWRPFRRLTGHESDVCDLAWAPDNRYLATCGLDNTIFIWHGRSFERVAKLTGHKQFVKGLTFDPAGRYLASQSDDKTLKIWRTSDWALQATVGKPFEDNIFSTYFRRPSWSPDGDCIAAANAANGKVPVAAVLRRGTWTADLSFVGHRAAIEAVRFNPRVFNVADTTAAHSETKEKTVTVCAAGGQDRGVSVWLTSQHMPIAAATSLFQGNLMDLAWHTVESAAGQPHDVIAYLAACSYDGTVAILEFTRAELGSPVSQADQEALLARHGWTRLQVGSGYKRSHGDGYDDDDDDVDRDGDGGGNGNGDDNDGGGYARKHARPLVESIEQVKLEERGAELSHALPQSKSQSQSQSHNLSQNPIPQQPATESAPATATKEPDTPPITMPVPTRTPNGRKRVAPVFLRPLGGYTTPAAVSIPDTQTQTQAQAQALTSAANATVTVVAPSSDDQRYPVNAPLWIEARVLGSRQLRSQNDTTSSSAASGAALSLAPQSLIHAQSISAARVHLNVPKVVAQVTARAHSSFSKPGIQQAKKLPMLVAYNSSGPSGGQAASTTSLKGGSHLVCTVPQDPPAQSGSEAPQHSWTVYFSASVVMLAASQQITAAMLTDGSLHWFDTGSGTRLLPPLMSEAHPAYLVCKQQHCLLLDCVGQLTVWDTERLEALVDHVSIAPLLYASEMRVRDDHNAMLSDRPSSSASHGTAADADGGSQATIAGDKKNSTANGSSSSSSSPCRYAISSSSSRLISRGRLAVGFLGLNASELISIAISAFLAASTPWLLINVDN